MTLGRGVTPPPVYLEHTNTNRVAQGFWFFFVFCFFVFWFFFLTLMSPFLYRIFTNRDRYQPPNRPESGGSA